MATVSLLDGYGLGHCCELHRFSTSLDSPQFGAVRKRERRSNHYARSSAGHFSSPRSAEPIRADPSGGGPGPGIEVRCRPTIPGLDAERHGSRASPAQRAVLSNFHGSDVSDRITVAGYQSCRRFTPMPVTITVDDELAVRLERQAQWVS